MESASQARNKGVRLSSSVASGLAPCCSKNFTVSARPFKLARCSAVRPPFLVALSVAAPAIQANERCTRTNKPNEACQWQHAMPFAVGNEDGGENTVGFKAQHVWSCIDAHLVNGKNAGARRPKRLTHGQMAVERCQMQRRFAVGGQERILERQSQPMHGHFSRQEHRTERPSGHGEKANNPPHARQQQQQRQQHKHNSTRASKSNQHNALGRHYCSETLVTQKQFFCTGCCYAAIAARITHPLTHFEADELAAGSWAALP